MNNMKSPNAEKGARYLSQLDQALCNGSWADIAELARKTDKHAPDRKCLTLAARTEAQIAAASHRPTSASSDPTASIHGLGQVIPQLKEAIAGDTKYKEDAYAAQLCLAEIYWLREDWEAVLDTIPEGGFAVATEGSHVSALGWLEVCEIKAAYIHVAALESGQKEDELRQRYLDATQRVPGSRTPELRMWTERFLARACIYMRPQGPSHSLQAFSESLHCFSAWLDFWQRAVSPSAGRNVNPGRLDIPRRSVWRAYYKLLSDVLHYGLVYNPSSSSMADLLLIYSDDSSILDEELTSARRRQRADLRTVENTYESLLLDETQFPRASQTNTEVEEWVEQLVANWKVVCGSEWTDTDLGEGGKESIGRIVLDALYRAATKTFHSTAVLRHLFTVHSSLGDFELAMHAFDSYVEIVSKGKDRAEKTGQHELGFDTDDSALTTAAEAIRILCRYGDREQAEKALAVTKVIQRWLGQRRPGTVQSTHTNGTLDNSSHAVDESISSTLTPETLAAAYRAIGLSQANWIRLTYETESRARLQDDARKSLERAQMCSSSIDSAHALALLLAEVGDVQTATTMIKAAFTKTQSNEDASTDFSNERKLVPMWHLLALCLSANDEYEQALRMCEAAFGQFGNVSILYGDVGPHASQGTTAKSRSNRGLVDQMEDIEKDQLLQIKMTEIVILELMQGADAAVEASRELLSLYARLFGEIGTEHSLPTKPRPETAFTSTTYAKTGTLRSLAGSIRSRSRRRSLANGTVRSSSSPPPPIPEHQTSAVPHDVPERDDGAPVSITVTNEDGNPAPRSAHHKHLLFKHRHHTEPQETEALQEQVGTDTQTQPGSAASHSGLSRNEQSPNPVAKPAVEQTISQESAQQPLGEVPHNQPHDVWPQPTGHKNQALRQDVRLPAPHPASSSLPEPRFPSALYRRHNLSELVQLWLFTAGLYLRAELLEDAKSAINEARKLVTIHEGEMASLPSNARKFYERGWGGGKSVDELWADVCSAEGDLAASRELPFEAMEHYEQALAHFPDHPEGIIGISNFLMDIYEENMPSEKPEAPLQPVSSGSGTSPSIQSPVPPRPALLSNNPPSKDILSSGSQANARSDPTPAQLNRLAARDRAYMLLSNLTRLGSGWDNPEAWLGLARAHEVSKQIEKAKQALWWIVKLEEKKPVRPWRVVTQGGFTL